jgi:hypothetical protein
MRQWTLGIVAILMAPVAFAQADFSDLNDSIKNFKGLGDEVKKANPIIGITQGGAGEAGSLLKGLGFGGKKKEVTFAPVRVRLSKEQQDALDRSKRDASRAARRPLRATPTKTALAPPSSSLVPALTTAAQAPMTMVDESKLGAIPGGASRDFVIASLGKPSFSSSVSGLDEGVREMLGYHLDKDNTITVRLVDGKVTRIVR